MSIPEFTLRLIERKLREHCAGRAHEALPRRVCLGWAIEDDVVTLFEERRGLLDGATRVRLDMARFRFDPGTGKWKLYYTGAGPAWHAYYLKPLADFETLLREVDEDPLRVFWWGRG